MFILTYPIIQRYEVPPLIKNHVEDHHDEKDYVEGSPDSGEVKVSVSDNHVGENKQNLRCTVKHNSN